MTALNSIHISFASEPWFIAAGAVLLILYAIYIYKNTIPVVNPLLRTILIILRSAVLILILLLIFEPLLTIKSSESIEPVTIVFVDNTASIAAKDSARRAALINDAVSDIITGSNSQNRIYTFGKNINQIDMGGAENIKLRESVTNFDSIFSFIKKTEANISSVVIISDGIITDGQNPIYSAEKIDKPVFTIGVGDTTSGKDIEIKKVLYNEYIYAGKTTEISATILNKDYEGKDVIVSLWEDSEMIEQKKQTLGTTGIDNVKFNYTPASEGEKKIIISISPLKDEATNENNRKIFFVNVLNDKLNILLLTGAPSSDFSFIKNSLRLDPNIDIRTITQLSENRFLEQADPESRIDSADILFLIGFPAQHTPVNLFSKVSSVIKDKGKPFFILVNPETSLIKLKEISGELPFSIGRITRTASLVQPYVADNNNAILSDDSDDLTKEWTNMPPVLKTDSEINARPESSVILSTILRNVQINAPLFLSRKIGNRRSLAMLAGDIWKWKLQLAPKNSSIFDNLIMNSIKWLNVENDKKQIDIKTTKKIYRLGETVEFIGNVYDETFSAVNDADVIIKVQNKSDQYELILENVGNGIYSGEFQTNVTGDFRFEYVVKTDGNSLGKDSGKFSIGDVNVELLNPAMDKYFLQQLSSATGGKYFDASNIEGLSGLLNTNFNNSTKVKFNESSYNIWSAELSLVILIILFGIEWLLRKRAGML